MILLKPDIQVLLWISAYTLLIFGITFSFLTSRNQKILYTAFVFCFFIYNGYGIAYPSGVYQGFGDMYAVFLAVLSLGYILFLALVRKEVNYAYQGTIGLLRKLFNDRLVVNTAIGMYLAVCLFRLCYPEFKLLLLFNPPKPDILAEFSSRFTNPPDTISKLVQALSHLVFPFYLISVTYYRNNIFVFAFLIAFPYYLLYCAQSYISRSEVIGVLFILFAMQWYYRPRARKYLVIAAVIILPIVPIMLVKYQEERAVYGQTDLNISTGDALDYLIYSETSFPTFSNKVIRSDKHIDLKRYFIWMVTLPIPKAIIGSVNPPSAGMEMSEILLGTRSGRQGFFALLAGLLTESVYIYGVRCYFLHAVMIALVMALVVRLTENEPLLFVIFITLTLNLSYALNRAGIGAVLPAVVNLYFTLYLLFFLGYLKRRWRLI